MCLCDFNLYLTVLSIIWGLLRSFSELWSCQTGSLWRDIFISSCDLKSKPEMFCNGAGFKMNGRLSADNTTISLYWYTTTLAFSGPIPIQMIRNHRDWILMFICSKNSNLSVKMLSNHRWNKPKYTLLKHCS